jgi:tRNA pseudouridine13 synthase
MSRMALEGNGFRVRLRDLSAEEADTLATRWADLVESGAPAYFDDQRFGSLRGGGGFAALHLLRGDAEAALRAVIASPSREDRAPVRERKRRLAAVWGDWDAALAEVAGTPTRGALLHLRTHPRDFEGAFARLDRDEKRLFASAYASAVWNRAVVARIEALVPPDDRIVLRGAAGPLVFPKAPRALDAWREDVLPLPAPGATASDPAWQEALEAALAEDGLALDRLALAPSLAMPLRPTKRRVLFGPQEPRLEAPLPDDLNAGRFALALAFALGPGLYATILLKRLAWDLGGPKAFS